MNPALVFHSGFIGVTTGLIIVLIVLLWKVVSFRTAQILSEWIQNTVLLLSCVFGMPFIVGMIFGAWLEKALWSRVLRNA